ncbi:MAG: FUSC family protein [Actinobacteria bacterium]|nr:FUSC family protein [Actinomycetota bacterium]
MTTPSEAAAPAPPAVAWDGGRALFGLVCALPAAAACLADPAAGLALGVGAIPALAVGVVPARRGRAAIVLAGGVIAAGLMLGSVLALLPVVAVLALGLLCVAASYASRRGILGRVALLLGVPMAAAGLSYDGPADAWTSAALLLAGSVVTWLVALVWPAGPPAARAPAAPERGSALEYGVRLGIAGAACAAAGFALGFDHEGWAAAACLLVMRPSAEATRLRAAGRAAFVAIGAGAAVGAAHGPVPDAVLGVLVLVDLVAMAATRPSRWYVTGGFTTFLVISMLAWQEPGTAWFQQRLLETLLGVAAALAATAAGAASEGRP